MKNRYSTLASENQFNVEEARAAYLENGYGTALDKNRSLARFMSRQEMAKLLAYIELFQSTRGVIGSIAECGVFMGGGLATYANLAAALEPYNYQCKCVGFDTFSGNEGLGPEDLHSKVDFSEQKYKAENYEDLRRFIELYDCDRPISQIPRVELVKGDLKHSAGQYLEENPETLFRIVHLSVNLYIPTKETIKTFLPRLSSGGILAVHALNYSASPTKALLESLNEFGYSSTPIKIIDYFPNIGYWIKP